MKWSIAAAVVGLLVSAVAGAAYWAWLQPVGSPGGEEHGEHWVAFSDPTLEGHPQHNTSEIWVAVISGVSSEERLSSYTAGLYREGGTFVDPVPVRPGMLGISGSVSFEFFDYGKQCSPTPCPPPDGPDGMLNANDYFRLSGAASGESYVVRVFWADSGKLAGEIAIDT